MRCGEWGDLATEDEFKFTYEVKTKRASAVIIITLNNKLLKMQQSSSELL